MTEDVLDFQPGAPLLGTPYQVVRLIGAGGMGAVFEVEHLRLKKRLMAKTMHPGLRARQDFVTRMEVEAQTLARIAHPNIVQVHDLGVTDDGIPFFIMEKLEGSDLRKLLRARRSPRRQGCRRDPPRSPKKDCLLARPRSWPRCPCPP